MKVHLMPIHNDDEFSDEELQFINLSYRDEYTHNQTSLDFIGRWLMPIITKENLVDLMKSNQPLRIDDLFPALQFTDGATDMDIDFFDYINQVDECVRVLTHGGNVKLSANQVEEIVVIDGVNLELQCPLVNIQIGWQHCVLTALTTMRGLRYVNKTDPKYTELINTLMNFKVDDGFSMCAWFKEITDLGFPLYVIVDEINEKIIDITPTIDKWNTIYTFEDEKTSLIKEYLEAIKIKEEITKKCTYLEFKMLEMGFMDKNGNIL